MGTMSEVTWGEDGGLKKKLFESRVTECNDETPFDLRFVNSTVTENVVS